MALWHSWVRIGLPMSNDDQNAALTIGPFGVEAGADFLQLGNWLELSRFSTGGASQS